MFFAKGRQMVLVVALCGWACASPQGKIEAPPGASVPPAGAGSAAAGSRRGPPRLEKTYTGRATPSLSVKNRFPIDQYVFLDWKLVGRVVPATSIALELKPGTHTVTSADSADPDDNAVSITEDFEPGFAYSYEIAAE